MFQRTDDLRIREIKELVPPSHVLREFPIGKTSGNATIAFTALDPPTPRPRAYRRGA